MSNPHASDRALMKKTSSAADNGKPEGNKYKISAEVRQELEDAYELIKGDGAHITAKEIGNVMKKLGLDPSKKELEEMIDEGDLDGYHAVNKKNFVKLMIQKIRGGSSNSDVDVNKEAFHVFDLSGQGKLVAADIRQIMTNVGEKLCDEEVEEMLKAVGADPSGITYDAFLQLLAA